MMRSGENNHHVHDGYGREMALSLDVKDKDEDKDEDESNNSIAQSFDEPSSENLIMDVSESECNIVAETLSQSDTSNISKELNYKDDVNLQRMLKNQVILTYSSAEGIFWTHLTSLISVHSQHPRKRLEKYVLRHVIVLNKRNRHQ